MNIKDISMEMTFPNTLTDNEEESKDKLDIIFSIQKNLMERYHDIEEKNLNMKIPKPPLNINLCSHQQRIKDYMWRMVEELGEASNCLKNKPWKVDQKETDIEHFLEELSDAFHFFIELCLLLGLTSENLFHLYVKKAKVNRFRQNSNY